MNGFHSFSSPIVVRVAGITPSSIRTDSTGAAATPILPLTRPPSPVIRRLGIR